MIYQWAHPHLVPSYFFLHQIYERSAAHQVKRLPSQNLLIAVKKKKKNIPAVSLPVVLGLHLMIITLCTLLVKVCAHQSILSSYFGSVSYRAAIF